MEINNFSDDDLKQLMKKYKEKQSRYELIYNEATIRNERMILNIHLEQIRRWREVNLEALDKRGWIHHKLLFDCIGFGNCRSSCSSPSTSLVILIQHILTSLHLLL